MSGASTSANTSTTKATTDESPATQNLPEQSTNKKPQLEEDDEFEDFPVEGKWRSSPTRRSSTRHRLCLRQDYQEMGRQLTTLS